MMALLKRIPIAILLALLGLITLWTLGAIFFDGPFPGAGNVVLVLLWLQLTLGLLTTWWTLEHLDGSEMVKFMNWANGILTLDPAAPDRLKDVALVYKLHIILGLTLFLITPFTRLVHIWSAPIWFLIRPGYQIVRSRRLGRKGSPTRGPAGVAPSYGGDTVMRTALDEGRAT